MKRTIRVLVILLIFSFVIGCDRIQKFFPQKQIAPSQAPKVTKVPEEVVQGTMLAKVNDKIITLEEFEQNLKNLKALSKEMAQEINIDTFEAKKNLLDEMVNQELLYQEAKSRGITNKKEIKDLAEGYLRGLAVRQLIIDVTENVAVDAQEIETFYNQYKDQFSEPEQRRIREIAVSSEDRAREILIQLLQGADFATVAKEKSISESSAKAGDIGFITFASRGEEYRKYDEIAFSLDVGQISSIFKGPKGYYIIKVEEVKSTETKSLTDVWEDVKNSLLVFKQQQRAEDLLDKLKKDAKIELNEDLLK